MIDQNRLLGLGSAAAAGPRLNALGAAKAARGSSRPRQWRGPAERVRRLPMIGFLAHFLIVLAAWTVTIKFLFPIAYALAHRAPVGTYVYWDFWWVVHLWLAWGLLRWQPYTYALAIGVSAVEIAIIVTKFALFLSEPEWTIWTTNWFINKLFVLACFGLMLPYFALWRRDLRQGSSAQRMSATGDVETVQR